MRKPSKVVFISDSLEKSFNSLKETDFLRISIRNAVLVLRQNAFAGIQIPKRLIPKEYIRKWSVNNLWKYDLPKGWRLIYTIAPDNEVDLICAILEWFDHKDYERRFKY